MILSDIFKSAASHDEIIAALSAKQNLIHVPWEAIKKNWFPEFHRINDRSIRKDKIREDGVEPVSRVALQLEQLLAKRVTDFMFALPVKRSFDCQDEVQQQVAYAIERILSCADIDGENLRRGLMYFASCECCTVWYAVKSPNDLYGFHSEYKLKCKTYSPMDGTELYPLFDEYDDLMAMSFRYRSRMNNGSEFFETYTADRRYRWMRGKDTEGWQLLTHHTDAQGNVIAGEEIKLAKIPAIYLWRPVPIFHGLSLLRDELEFRLSENADIVAYNAAPVLKIVGQLFGEPESKGDSRRVIRVDNGGDVSYVSWDQSIQASKDYIDRLLSLFWMQAQMPDISFESISKLGQIGYDARMTLFTDAHLKVREESSAWLQAFRREINVIKAFLKLMNPAWASAIDNLSVQISITPYIQRSESNDIDMRLKANGGKPLESHLESIQRLGISRDPMRTLDLIKLESNDEEEPEETAKVGFRSGAELP